MSDLKAVCKLIQRMDVNPNAQIKKLARVALVMHEALQDIKPNGFMDYKGEEACKVVLSAITLEINDVLAEVENIMWERK